MNWWDLVAEKRKYPWVALEPSSEGDFRFPAAMLCLLLGLGSLVAGFVGLFLSALAFGVGAIALGVALIVAGNLLIPPNKPRR